MLEKIIQWGEKEEAIKTLILLGSRAGRQPVDAFSDYDLSVFCDDYESYIQSEAWLSQFGNVWVCVNEKVFLDGNTFPSRLVIFEGGIKVDFSFLTIAALEGLVHSNPLPKGYSIGYKVLLDKEKRTAGMLAPQFEIEGIKPSEQEFHELVNEFWFEVYHVGVYLKREDLWSVKFRSWATHTFLLRMIEWHVLVRNNWHAITPPDGKRMPSWVSKDIWKDLHKIFAHFDSEDSQKALFKTMELFKKLTAETAQVLGYSNQEDLSENMKKFILTLKTTK